MRIYQTLIGLLIAAMLLVSSAVAGVSDSEHINNFEVAGRNLLERLDTAKSIDNCEDLKVEISRLGNEYQQYKEKIDFKLDETFDSRMQALSSKLEQVKARIIKDEEDKAAARAHLNAVKADLNAIKVNLDTANANWVAAESNNKKLADENTSLKVQVEKLEGEITSFNASMVQLSKNNEDLVEEIKAFKLAAKASQEDLDKLKSQINELNSKIKDRDDLIVKLMEKLNDDFEKSKLPAKEKENLTLNINSDQFQETLLSTIRMNLNFLDSTSLEAADIKVLREEQRRFADRWISLKPEIAKLYSDNQAKIQALQIVDDQISSWKQKISETIWKRVHQVLISQNIPVAAFADATEFHDNILKYIDDQINSPSLEKFNAFQKVWGEQIKEKWLPVIQADNTLTLQQGKAIDDRISLWGDKSSGKFGVMIWGVGVFGVLALIIIFAVSGKRLSRKFRSTGSRHGSF